MSVQMIEPDKSGPVAFSVLTYNVHGCVGTDRRRDIDRIVEVIAASGADIVLLQELDVGRRRSDGIDQAHEIALKLAMRNHFHAALHVEEEKYGDAILTAHPSELVHAGALPAVGEPRGALWVDVTIAGRAVQVINTHLGLRSGERMAQVEALLGPAWLGHPRCLDGPAIFGGDLNAIPSSAVFRRLSRGLVTETRTAWRLKPTFHARYPLLRLDHLFHHGGLELADMSVITTPLARLASDHLPLLAEFRFPTGSE